MNQGLTEMPARKLAQDMAKVTIKRRNESERKDGRALLYAVLYLQGSKIRIPLDLAVTSEEWDPVKETVRGRGNEVRDYNLIISDTKAKISDIMVRARLSGEKLTRERFLSLYTDGDQAENFIRYAEQRLDSLETVLRPETRRHHRTVLKKLKEFNPDLTFGDITVDWLRIYAAHLKNHCGNCQNTVGKNMSIIRTHFMAALRDGKVRSNPFGYYKIKSGKPAVIYLTENELASLISMFKSGQLPDNQQETLRLFLFMAFTGMHFTDAKNLHIEQIVNGEILYSRIKTGTQVRVPLSLPARKLTDHYRGERTRGVLIQGFPTNQNFNRLIKDVCKEAKIEKAVSAKAARHTFATLYYKKNGGDIGTLSRLLGHTSVNTTMIYAHIMKESRVAGVSVFDDML